VLFSNLKNPDVHNGRNIDESVGIRLQAKICGKEYRKKI
jgi:hypothetical protein